MRPSLYLTLLVLGWAIVEASASDPFSRMNDVLKDEATLLYYAHCLLDKGPCSGEGRAIKRMLPDFIATSCGRCTARQKQLACKILFTLQQDKYDDLWSEFLKKYDPHGNYQGNLRNFKILCKDNFNIYL